jgi:alanine-glyoxylate transaminase/serine-glyoxylate transaminase/serine-pyruvate transaminase
VRGALDRLTRLLLVDTISSLASIDYRHDEWGVDLSVGGSQKGLMPPGLSFNDLGKALAASKQARLPSTGRGTCSRRTIRATSPAPATNLLRG